tara:strand:+ start:4613 stop:4807 length:195 start_codon:yes stop_codon:yes gene_type:complete
MIVFDPVPAQDWLFDNLDKIIAFAVIRPFLADWLSEQFERSHWTTDWHLKKAENLQFSGKDHRQ